jgi:membrane fusion protein (multidrug efflux system)
MKSRSLVFILMAAAAATAGCRGAESRSTSAAAPAARTSEGAASTQAAPTAAPPEDVREVAQAVVTDPAAAAAAPAAESPSGPLSLTGEFVSPMQSDVASKLNGRVGQVLVDEGARVTKGQALMRLETEYLQLDVRRADGERARAKAARDDAERELSRKQDLLAKGSVPQALYDKTQSAFDQAAAALTVAESAAALARQRLDDATLLSPVTGVVVKRQADVGEKLGDNSVAFVVAQTQPLRLRFRVPERYLSQVGKGQVVRASVAPYPQETFDGKVTLVGESVDPQSRTFLVEAEFANRDSRLKPGLFARVELQTKG